MEKNRMEWNQVTLIGCFKIKEWKWMKCKINLVWEQQGENEMESFYDNIIIRPLF